MKQIVKGTKHLVPYWATCKHCDSIFTCDRTELTIMVDDDLEYVADADCPPCPECNLGALYFKEGQPDLPFPMPPLPPIPPPTTEWNNIGLGVRTSHTPTESKTKKIVEGWPKWKRMYKLTPFSWRSK